MLRKIILPVDLTDRHQKAIDLAVDLAGKNAGSLTLFHVIETIAGIAMDEEKDFYQRLERKARSHLERLGKHLDKRNASWSAEVGYGSRAGECVRYAQDVAADLIVLTAPRIDPANPGAGWGSLSYKIGLLSQCPVLLVK
jgi:universal stress protein A